MLMFQIILFYKLSLIINKLLTIFNNKLQFGLYTSKYNQNYT